MNSRTVSNRYIPDHAISFPEALHAGADFVDFASDVAADDRWELLHEDPGVLLVPVDGIDSNGGVLDNDFVRACDWHWSWADFEGRVGLLEPGGLIRWGRHVGLIGDVESWGKDGCGGVWLLVWLE